APAAAPAAPVDRVAQLTALADLKAQGLLTDEEFAAEKARVLGA
ncbi:SHOCT domain-containing protein, partial [Streptomyces sp. YC504]